MFDPNDMNRTDALGQCFREIGSEMLPPPDLVKAAKAGVRLNRRVRTATHIRRFAGAVVLYAVCVALLLGTIFLLPRLLATSPSANTGVPTTPSFTEPTPSLTEPPTTAEIVWATANRDPWMERHSAKPLSPGRLYYTLDPALAEGQTTGENTRYVMSFTYVTADYCRFSLEDYLQERGFQKHVYEKNQDESDYMLFDLTEKEIQSITPASVQTFYGLEEAPAVVGIHRYMSKSDNLYNGYSHVNSEVFWYRVDLMWGIGYLSEDGKYGLGELRFYEELSQPTAEGLGWRPDTKCAVVVCVASRDPAIEIGACDDFFAHRGIKILPATHCEDKAYYTEQYTLLEISLEDLWTFTIEDIAEYYGYNPSSLIAACFLATQPSRTAIEGISAQ